MREVVAEAPSVEEEEDPSDEAEELGSRGKHFPSALTVLLGSLAALTVNIAEVA